MSASERILETAMAYVERGWTQVELAVDDAGHEVEPESSMATAWCATGAILAAMTRLGITDRWGYASLDDTRAKQAMYRLARSFGCADDDWRFGIEATVMEWNDRQDSAEDVILGFKQAIIGSGSENAR
jgi:hypothetical protein